MSGLCQNLSDSEWDGQYHLAFLSRSGGGRSRLGKWGVWRCSGPALMAPRRPSASQNKVSPASHLPPPDVIRSILGITLQAAQTWKRKVCASPVGGEGGGGGPCGGCEGLALDGGGETRKSDFAKRTWNVL